MRLASEGGENETGGKPESVHWHATSRPAATTSVWLAVGQARNLPVVVIPSQIEADAAAAILVRVEDNVPMGKQFWIHRIRPQCDSAFMLVRLGDETGQGAQTRLIQAP